MKTSIKTLLVSLLLVVGSVTQGWAQFRTTCPVSDPTYAAPPLELPAMTTSQQTLPYAGNHLLDAGKALTYTGAGILLNSAIVGVIEGYFNFFSIFLGSTAEDLVEDIVYRSYRIDAGIIAGGVMLLSGVPIWIAAKSLQGSYEEYRYSDDSRGFEVRTDVTIARAPLVGVDIVGGYNFNPYLFLGAGIGQRFVKGYTFPVYADARFSFSNKRVAPFVDLNFGGAYYKNPEGERREMYFAANFGVRIRHKAQGNHKGDWWISAGFETQEQAWCNSGLRVGYSINLF